jgi:hypothetical protein
VTVYEFSKGERIRTSHYRRARVFNRSGIDQMSAITRTFSASSELCAVNFVRVRAADGSLVSAVERQAMYVTNDTDEDSMVTDEQTVNIPVPGLSPGVTIESCITVTSKGNADEFDFSKRFLVSGFPVHTDAVVFVGDVNAIRHHASMPPQEFEGGLLWTANLPATFVWENRQPPLEDFLPFVAIASATATWPELVRNYRARIAPKLVGCSRTKELAAAQKDADALAASIAWIRDNLSYKAIEFGVRGVVPNTPEATLKNRWGDCKDHAVLLQQLLAERGLESKLALVSSGERLLENLPSLDQFNHMILYLPGEQRFIDPTDSGADSGDHVPEIWLDSKPWP